MNRILFFLICVVGILAVLAPGLASAQVPGNDTCDTATDIRPAFSDTPDAPNATADIDVSCNSSALPETSYGVWYHYTPTSDGTLNVVENSANDAVLALFTGANCGSLTEVECSDPEDANWSVTSGTEYWILIGMWSNSAPPLPFSIDFTGPLPVEIQLFSIE